MTEKQTFAEHAEELRWRILRLFLVFAAAAILVFPFSKPLLQFLLRPIGKAVYFSPYEALLVHLKLDLATAAVFTFPYFLWEGWNFISTALFPREKRLFFLYFPLALIAFCLGVSFAFFTVLPFSLQILLGFSSEALQPMISVNHYFSFVSTLVLSFAVLFELPPIVLLLSHLGLLTPEVLIRQWRYCIVAIFILAAAISPGTDIFSQLLMVVPIALLYCVSIFLSYVGCWLWRTGKAGENSDLLRV